jgi:hypothetical protein
MKNSNYLWLILAIFISVMIGNAVGKWLAYENFEAQEIEYPFFNNTISDAVDLNWYDTTLLSYEKRLIELEIEAAKNNKDTILTHEDSVNIEIATKIAEVICDIEFPQVYIP